MWKDPPGAVHHLPLPVRIFCSISGKAYAKVQLIGLLSWKLSTSSAGNFRLADRGARTVRVCVVVFSLLVPR